MGKDDPSYLLAPVNLLQCAQWTAYAKKIPGQETLGFLLLRENIIRRNNLKYE